MGDRSGIEWTDASWNPTVGCSVVSPGCDNCLDPETPVLMADMSWRPIGKLNPGDEVVGFSESPSLGQNRVYERASVVHVWSTEAEAVEITVGRRSVVASVDHRFLADVRPYWREAERLALWNRIVDIGMPGWLPVVDSEPFLSGYVAGAVGGDGTMRIDGSGKGGTKQSYLRVAVLATDRPILDRMARALAALQCDEIHVRPFDSGGSLPVPGGRQPMLKIETRRMANLVKVRDVCLPERDDPDWKAGFLAGFLDTDGCYSGKNLRFNQTKQNGLLDACRRYISDLGFASQREDFRSSSGRGERIVGDIEEKIRFLSTIQPALSRKAADFYGRRFPSKGGARVDGVRRVGVRSLVDIQTSSGTFIAAGLATHNCYAERLAVRLRNNPAYEGVVLPGGGWSGRVNCRADRLDVPLRWSRPRRIFVNSMSDLFHEDVSMSFVAEVFAVMGLAEWHTFQILTKRPRRMADMLSSPEFHDAWYEARNDRALQVDVQRLANRGAISLGLRWPLPNVWVGTSVESDRYVFRADDLRRTPAAVRWISAEPLIAPIHDVGRLLTGLDWLVVGGESGPGARPMHPAWARTLLEAAEARGVAPFFKQHGEWQPIQPVYGPDDLLDDPTLDDYDDTDVLALETDGTVAMRLPAADMSSGRQPRPDTDPWWMARVGKHTAGRLLDGRLYDRYPEPAHA